jgi:hypothetical protein
MIHGAPLGPGEANIIVINVRGNVLIAYEDKIDVCESLKETEMSFIRWSKKYLRKSSS